VATLSTQNPRPTGLAAFVYQTLLERIVTGLAKPGSRLVIDQIAKELQVSLIPVRGALARLSAEGLVAYRLNHGYRVTPSPTVESYREIFIARLALETGAIRHAPTPVDEEQVEHLREINEQIERLRPSATYRGFHQFVELNDAFHLTLVQMSRNKSLLDLYSRLAYGSRTIRRLQGRGVPDLAQNVREHNKIIGALQKSDLRAAAEAAEQHIIAGMHRFLQGLDPIQPARKRLSG
jgi:DNA-binding GntR family transcriptional regulator